MGLFSLFADSSNLYFPGCKTYLRFQDHFDLYKRIFSKLGIRIKVIDKQVCCGLPALESGYESDARKVMRRNFEIFKEEKIVKIITSSPCCYHMFNSYNQFFPDWNIEVVNVWKLILEKIQNRPRLVRNPAMEKVGFHDNCYLGRYSGIYEEPRKILEMIGYEIDEIPDNRENSFCSGSCGGLPRVNSTLANKVAKERLLQFKRAGVRKLIVMSIDDYELLKKNSAESEIEVVEFAEVLGKAIGLSLNVGDVENE